MAIEDHPTSRSVPPHQDTYFQQNQGYDMSHVVPNASLVDGAILAELRRKAAVYDTLVTEPNPEAGTVVDFATVKRAINIAVAAVPGMKNLPPKDYIDLYLEVVEDLKEELEIEQDQLG